MSGTYTIVAKTTYDEIQHPFTINVVDVPDRVVFSVKNEPKTEPGCCQSLRVDAERCKNSARFDLTFRIESEIGSIKF